MTRKPIDTTAQRVDPLAELDLSSFSSTSARKPPVDRDAIREASEQVGFPSRDPPRRANGAKRAPVPRATGHATNNIDNRNNGGNIDNRNNGGNSNNAAVVGTIAYIEGLVACGLPLDELVADILTEITARHPSHAAEAEKLIRRAPAGKLKAAVVAFFKSLARAEKAAATAASKRIYNRDRNRVLRGSSNVDNSATAAPGTTSTTRQH